MTLIYLGWKNSKHFLIKHSRPNKLDELSYQEEVTSTLKNVLKTGNVYKFLIKAPSFVILWTCRNWKNISYYRAQQITIRVN
jgi:hypothetical protein